MKDDPKELFIVVDEDDNILEYRTRYDCHHDNSLIHRSVGVVIYNKKGDILVQKRSMHKDINPGLYNISVAGHVTKGQTYVEAAMREMEEELGIQTSIRQLKKYITKNPQESHMNVLFEGEYDGPFAPSKDEVDKVEFLPIKTIQYMKDQFTPNSWKALKKLHIV